MKNAVTNKIRLFKDIQPNPDWLKSQRSNLLLEISQSGKKAHSVWKLPVFVLPDFAFKPVMVSLLLLCLILAGGTLAVYGAKNSLPGDLFYPVKITLENARVKVSSQETKSKLQAEFVGNRVEELSQIIEEMGDPIEKKEKVVKAVDKLQAQVVNTKFHVVEAAEAVSEKAVQAEEVLIEAKEKLTEEFKEDESNEVVEAIDEALAAIIAANQERENWIQMEVKLQKELPVEEIPSK